jgi:predicted nucleic acid-binding protein
MNVYIDTSVILRRLLDDPHAMADWGNWEQAYTSRLWQVETFRAINRLRLEKWIQDQDVAILTENVSVINASMTIIPVSDQILIKAGEPLPTVLSTLDAIHLASAMMLAPAISIDRFLTHDRQLAVAARSVGFVVDGINESA